MILIHKDNEEAMMFFDLSREQHCCMFKTGNTCYSPLKLG